MCCAQGRSQQGRGFHGFYCWMLCEIEFLHSPRLRQMDDDPEVCASGDPACICAVPCGG